MKCKNYYLLNAKIFVIVYLLYFYAYNINPSWCRMNFDKTNNIYLLGKINLEYLKTEFCELQTDEIIITTERISHILQRHENDYDLFLQYIIPTISHPDIIVNDNKNFGTVFMIKKLDEININVVVRVALNTDKKGFKNSIITFYRLRDKNLEKLIKKNKIIYNH